jgi:ABC-type multidrug transport system fused ATPase/permease subunit
VAAALEAHLALRLPAPGGMLLVAHRLSTVRNAHTLIVLADGRVAEAGSYDELVAKEGGAFRALVARQLQSADGGEAEPEPETQ